MTKPRILFVGGKACGLPPELRERFEVVRHVSNEMGGWGDNMVGLRVDYVFVIVDFADHSWIGHVKKRLGKGVPFVYLKKGWPHMKTRLERLGILSAASLTAPLPETPPASPRCAYGPCSRSWTEKALFQYGVYCCKVCRNAAQRKGLKVTV
jgi:hypothetical protein